jgi:hypothetical protein
MASGFISEIGPAVALPFALVAGVSLCDASAVAPPHNQSPSLSMQLACFPALISFTPSACFVLQCGCSATEGLKGRNPRRVSTMSVPKADIRKLQKQLDEWGAEIDELKERTERAEAGQATFAQIEELEQMHETAAEILAGFQEIQEDKQELVKEVVESAWESLGQAVRSAERPHGRP